MNKQFYWTHWNVSLWNINETIKYWSKKQKKKKKNEIHKHDLKNYEKIHENCEFSSFFFVFFLEIKSKSKNTTLECNFECRVVVVVVFHLFVWLFFFLSEKRMLITIKPRKKLRNVVVVVVVVVDVKQFIVKFNLLIE